GGSNPFASSSSSAHSRENGRRRWSKYRERVLSNLKSAQPCAGMVVCPRPTADSNYLAQTNETRTRSERACLSSTARAGTSYGQVAEWSKAADCKSADPCGLRRFEPSPVHQFGVRNSKFGTRMISKILSATRVSKTGGSNSVVE